MLGSLKQYLLHAMQGQKTTAHKKNLLTLSRAQTIYYMITFSVVSIDLPIYWLLMLRHGLGQVKMYKDKENILHFPTAEKMDQKSKALNVKSFVYTVPEDQLC